MKDITVTNQNIQDFFEELISEIDEHGSVICSTKTASTGKWGMARLWQHGWLQRLILWLKMALQCL